jgi:asparagine synthase (glutamine-hydrolysing)
MVLSGEGADELFGGICIFTKRHAKKLGNCICDCLRANKFSSVGNRRSCSVLDKEFMDVAMRINPQDKMINKEHPMENGWFVKHLKICYQSVAWNKRAVSDGVGYSWIDTLKEVVAKEVWMSN